jgi:glucose-6-phosphate-specific signal transduction histidine kinase
MQNIDEKIGTSNRLERALYAISKGLVNIQAGYAKQEDVLAKLEAIHQRIERDLVRSRLLVRQLVNPKEAL